MSSLHATPDGKKPELSPDLKFSLDITAIEWQLKFLAEAIPEWVNSGFLPSEDAAAGVGKLLNQLADQIETVVTEWEENNAK